MQERVGGGFTVVAADDAQRRHSVQLSSWNGADVPGIRMLPIGCDDAPVGSYEVVHERVAMRAGPSTGSRERVLPLPCCLAGRRRCDNSCALRPMDVWLTAITAVRP